MRTRRVNRYYCDFCKKAGCSAHHMQKHERGCTANPDRICGVCGRSGDQSALHEAATKGIAALRDEAECCPACMLVAVRRHLRERYDAADDAGGTVRHDTITCEMADWDYKKAHDEWWAQANEDHREWAGY